MNYTVIKIRIGREIQFSDIKIGEAFYFNGCEGIGVKKDLNRFFLIDIDPPNYREWTNEREVYNSSECDGTCHFKYYKLPKKIKDCIESQ